jgi:hypothetical protein
MSLKMHESFVRDQGVGGSNPLAPTITYRQFKVSAIGWGNAGGNKRQTLGANFLRSRA